MPDIITHHIFGNEIISKLKQDIKEKIKNKFELFHIGCQGPDPFLYNYISSINGKKIGRELGDRLHEIKCGDFIINFLKHLKKINRDSPAFNELLSYISGFVCHYSLDKTTHPYIYYVTGIYDKNNPETFNYRGNHKRLEIAMDTVLLYEMYNIHSRKYKITDNILKLKTIPNSILSIYDKLLNDMYDIKSGGEIFLNSYRDMRRIVNISYDPFGIKKFLANIIDKTINKYGSTAYSTLSYYKSCNKEIDYLNKNKKYWYHPCNDNEKYNFNFYELMNNASNTALIFIEIIFNYLNDLVSETDLYNIFKNESYNTGKENVKYKDIKYFNVIFK